MEDIIKKIKEIENLTEKAKKNTEGAFCCNDDYDKGYYLGEYSAYVHVLEILKK